jgi:hypothetical protein
MARRIPPYRPPAAPPATTAEGAAFVRDHVVKLYDRQDGQGVDWRLIAETLFRASFDVLDRLPDEVCRSVASRVHAGSYERMAEGPKTDSAASNSGPPGGDLTPSNTAGLKSPRPRPPHGTV